jgi:hypothetical protein
MVIRDEEGVLSSIVYGPASRARITPTTRRLLFTVYCPAGIKVDLLRGHLSDIRDNVLVVAPQAEVEWIQVVSGHAETEARGAS